MISSKVQLTRQQTDFTIWQVADFFDPIVLAKLLDEIQKYPYKLTLGDRTETNGVRVWGHQTDGWLKSISNMFAGNRTKRMLGNAVGVDFSNLSTRVELCMDSAMSWLRPHTDDPAKQFVLQIYLSDSGASTRLGSETMQSKVNSGWMFCNTGTELHELPMLLDNRASIIVNYVDSSWRDTTVLVEG